MSARDDGMPAETMACWGGEQGNDLSSFERERILRRILRRTRAIERRRGRGRRFAQVARGLRRLAFEPWPPMTDAEAAVVVNAIAAGGLAAWLACFALIAWVLS